MEKHTKYSNLQVGALVERAYDAGSLQQLVSNMEALQLKIDFYCNSVHKPLVKEDCMYYSDAPVVSGAPQSVEPPIKVVQDTSGGAVLVTTHPA